MQVEEIDYLQRNNVPQEAMKYFNDIMNYERGFTYCVICGKEAMSRKYIDGKFIYYCGHEHRRRYKLLEDIRKLYKE